MRPARSCLQRPVPLYIFFEIVEESAEIGYSILGRILVIFL
jgi:hypothetical protein